MSASPRPRTTNVPGDGPDPRRGAPPFDSRLRAPQGRPDTPPGFTLAYLAGRLTELSGPATLSLAIGLVRHAQQRMEPAAWVTSTGSIFFPPDAAACGVDLGALPIVRLAEAADAARAADHLLRSGAFGLVVLDVGDAARLPPALLTRLQGLALHHDAAVVFLTDKPPTAASISSLVAVRARAWRRSLAADRFAIGLEVLKDKRHGASWSHEERRVAPC